MSLVKVYDKYLYQDDIAALVPEGTTPQDSALKVRSYVEVWVRKQLMIKKAELYLTDEQKDVERHFNALIHCMIFRLYCSTKCPILNS